MDFLTGLPAITAAPLARRDFKREALFGWIRLVLVALSSAEETALKLASVFSTLAFLIKDLRLSFLTLFLAVLILSFLNFLIALLMSGMREMVTQLLPIRKSQRYNR